MTLKQLFLDIKDSHPEITMNTVALYLDRLFEEETEVCPNDTIEADISSDTTLLLNTDVVVDDGIIIKIKSIFDYTDGEIGDSIPRLVTDSVPTYSSNAVWFDNNGVVTFLGCDNITDVLFDVQYIPDTFGGSDEDAVIPVPRILNGCLSDFINWKLYIKKAASALDPQLSQQLSFLARYHTREFYRKLGRANMGKTKVRLRMMSPNRGGIL